jgi:hypothetical protein
MKTGAGAVMIYKPESLSPHLTAQERTALVAANGHRIGDVPEDRLRDLVTDVMAKANFLLGHKKSYAEDSDMMLLVAAVTTNLRQNFTNLTLSEFETAVVMGISKELPECDIVHVSAVNVNISIRAFLKHISKEAKWKQKKFEEDKKREERLAEHKIPEEEKQKRHYEWLIDFCKKENRLPISCAWWDAYVHAERIGEIKDTPEEKEIFVQLVETELNEEHKVEKLASGNFRIKVTQSLNILNSTDSFRKECQKRRIQSYLKAKFKL